MKKSSIGFNFLFASVLMIFCSMLLLLPFVANTKGTKIAMSILSLFLLLNAIGCLVKGLSKLFTDKAVRFIATPILKGRLVSLPSVIAVLLVMSLTFTFNLHYHIALMTWLFITSVIVAQMVSLYLAGLRLVKTPTSDAFEKD